MPAETKRICIQMSLSTFRMWKIWCIDQSILCSVGVQRLAQCIEPSTMFALVKFMMFFNFRENQQNLHQSTEILSFWQSKSKHAEKEIDENCLMKRCPQRRIHGRVPPWNHIFNSFFLFIFWTVFYTMCQKISMAHSNHNSIQINWTNDESYIKCACFYTMDFPNPSTLKSSIALISIWSTDFE